MAGRPIIAGERAWSNILNPTEVHRRTIRAQLESLDTTNGFARLTFDGLPSAGRPATLPYLWASFPAPRQGAWGRYMPFPRDMVKVSFDFDDTPHIVGYDAKAGLAPVADGRAGWTKVVRAQENGVLPHFKQLLSGEFDFMSVGGAYIFGSATGQLMLMGGPATIALTKSDNSIGYDAVLHKTQSLSSTLRFGQVRRQIPALGQEIAGTSSRPNVLALWNTDGSKSEFDVNVADQVGPVAIKTAHLALGAVSTDLGPDLAASGLPRRVALEVYDATGETKPFTMEVDTLGGMLIDSLDKVAVKAPTVDLGLLPTGGAVEGGTLANALSTTLTPLVASINALAAALSTPAPALKSDIGSALTPIASALQAIQDALKAATSTTVKVTL